MKRNLSLLLLALVAVWGCKKFDPEAQADLDEAAITQYIADNSLIAQSTGSGLYYIIDSLGTGLYPTINSTVTVAYKGYLLDGTVFDQSTSAGATFPLSNVIEGWQEGIPKFKEGGNGMLLIPSGLGYGNQSVGSIPVNSVLLFDVTLIDVQ
jgi:FKBP-type peptidyl-prolyl cis-trans isomerase FkpA